MDCTAEQDTCKEYGVTGYPTLKIFRGGEFSKEYEGPREAGKNHIEIIKYFSDSILKCIVLNINDLLLCI